MKNNLDDYGDKPQTVVRVGRSTNLFLPIAFISLIAVVMYWPLLYEFAAIQIDSLIQIETPPTDISSAQVLPDSDGSSSFDDVLDTALRYDREGERVLAAALFQQLLRQEAQNTGYTENAAALLPRAAEFYRKGNEIPAEQVAILYRDAYHAILKFHGPDYYDYENVHWGLEKHYLSLGRYKVAADQTRMLLEFYRRYYKDDEDVQFGFIQPTTIRLGHNLMAAGENADARNVYQLALEMSQARGRPTSAIEALIKKTYEAGPVTPETMTEIAMSASPLRLVAPVSMSDRAAMPTSLGANISPGIDTQISVVADSDLKTRIEAISMDGVYIEQLQETDNSLTIIGYADDNTAVAKYMRLIQAEGVDPLLNMVKREERQEKMVSEFSIRLGK